MELMIMLLVVIAAVAWFAVRSAGWKTILVGNGRKADEIEAKYAYLKSHKVRCRLKTESAAGAGVGLAQPGAAAEGAQTVKLNVHKKDIERANELLQQFEQETRS